MATNINMEERKRIINQAKAMAVSNIAKDTQPEQRIIDPAERMAYRNAEDGTNGYNQLTGYLFNIKDYEKASKKPDFFQYFDFNSILKINKNVSSEYKMARPIPFENHADKVFGEIYSLFKRYRTNISQPFKLFEDRIEALYFELWYTILSLNVELTPEFDYWAERMECACCPIYLENISICIKLLAGQQAEDRESYLAKLRPPFRKRLQELSTKRITCWCNEGVS